MQEMSGVNPQGTFVPSAIAYPGGGSQQTMSSREIADLVEKRHDNVKRTIETLVERGLVHPQVEDEPEVDAMGRTRVTKVYRVGKRDSYVIVAQLSPEFTARLVDRWEELERVVRGQKPRRAPRPPSAREIRAQFQFGLMLADKIGLRDNQAMLAANGLTRTTTGVDVLEAMGQQRLIASRPEITLTATDIGRELGKSAVAVNSLLAEHGFQIGRRDWKGRPAWEPTDKGRAAGAEMVDIDRGNGTGTAKQLRWASSIVEALRAVAAS